MTKDPKIATIERFFSAYAAHDLEGLASVLAADIEWTIPGRHPLSGTKAGYRRWANYALKPIPARLAS